MCDEPEEDQRHDEQRRERGGEALLVWVVEAEALKAEAEGRKAEIDPLEEAEESRELLRKDDLVHHLTRELMEMDGLLMVMVMLMLMLMYVTTHLSPEAFFMPMPMSNVQVHGIVPVPVPFPPWGVVTSYESHLHRRENLEEGDELLQLLHDEHTTRERL